MSDKAIGEDAIFRRKPSIISVDGGDNAFLLDIDSGMFFQLNPSAARIWELIEEPRSMAELRVAMMQRYAVDAETCDADVGAFVARMQAQGLIERASEA